MQNWSWIPVPRSWVIAIAVILTMAGFQHLLGYLWWLISWLITIFPRFIYIIYLLITISPIVLLASLHHWLHQLLDQLFPESRLPNQETATGGFPGLMSWWEGLYGWLVNHLSMIFSWAVLGIFLPLPSTTSILQFSPWSLTNLLNQVKPFFIITLLLQIIFAAFFYQFEYNVQQHLIVSGRRE
jgi:hypothetical protein